jgi:PAS domain-containing protein
MIKIAMLEGAHAFEWRHRRLDGREIPASVQLTRLEFAGQSLLQATVRDLGPTERALSALRDSEMRLRLAVEATGIGTYCWDHTTGKADYSPEFLALYGLPPDGVLPLGKDLVPLAVLDGDRPAFLAAMAAGNDVDGDGILKADYRVRRPDGSICWLMAHGRTEFTGAPGMRRLAKAAGIVMDITERKRAEELAAVRTWLQEFAVGHTPEELLQATADEAASLSDSLVGRFDFVEADERTLALRAWLPKGHPPVFRELVVPVLRKGKIVAILGVGNKATDYTKDDVSAITTLADVAWEIAQRKRAEIDLLESQEQLDKIFNGSANAMALTGPSSGTFLNVNETWVRESGISRLEAIGKTAKELGQLIPWDDANECYQTLELEGRLHEYETKLVLKGVERQFLLNAEFLELRRGQCLLWRHHRAQARRGGEGQARRASFSNPRRWSRWGAWRAAWPTTSTTCWGSSSGTPSWPWRQVDPPHPHPRRPVRDPEGGQRSAELTRQLLAFARKQTVAPKVLDLNQTVAGMLKMLQRLIGEDIDLAWLPGNTSLWPVKADPSQIDQILANLCVNARDAIAGVGKLTIETGNKVFDEDYCRDATRAMFPAITCAWPSATMAAAWTRKRRRISSSHSSPPRTGWQGHRPRVGHRLRHRETEQRLHQRVQRAGAWDDFRIYLPRHVGGHEAGCGEGRDRGRSRSATRPSCWWRTSRPSSN